MSVFTYLLVFLHHLTATTVPRPASPETFRQWLLARRDMQTATTDKLT
jgi:hypothetical protein